MDRNSFTSKKMYLSACEFLNEFNQIVFVDHSNSKFIYYHRDDRLQYALKLFLPVVAQSRRISSLRRGILSRTDSLVVGL